MIELGMKSKVTYLLFSLHSRHHLFGMSLFTEHVYYSELKTGMIRRANKYTGKVIVTISLKPPFLPPAEIKMVHPFKQPSTRTDARDFGKSPHNNVLIYI